MGRSRGGGNRRAAPAPPQRKKAPAPAPKQSAAPPAQPARQESMGSGLMGTIAQGMAFGTGSAIAHRAVGAVAGSFGGSSEAAPTEEAQPAQQQQQQPAQRNPEEMCVTDQKQFLECLNNNMNDISSCQFYLDQFNQCKQDAQFSHSV